MSNDPDSKPSRVTSKDTQPVPPPNYRERVLAAQKARTSGIRQSVEIPNPLLKKFDELPSANPIDPDQPPMENEGS